MQQANGLSSIVVGVCSSCIESENAGWITGSRLIINTTSGVLEFGDSRMANEMLASSE
jgi:hypothetical protein